MKLLAAAHFLTAMELGLICICGLLAPCCYTLASETLSLSWCVVTSILGASEMKWLTQL